MKLLKKILWPFKKFYRWLIALPRRWSASDRRSASLRLFMLMGSSLLAFWALSNIFERELLDTMVSGWRENPSLVLILLPFLDVFYRPVAVLLQWDTLRFLYLVIVPVFLALLGAARYIQDLYELESTASAFKYLNAALFGIGYPRLVIEKGQKKIEADEKNLLDIIGGPGYLVIRPGNVVLLEKLRGPSNVRAHGRHFIHAGETIKEITSLDEQAGELELVREVTKDGIEVHIRNIRYRYHLRTGHPAGQKDRTLFEPYPYSVEAVRNMAYHRNVVNITADTKDLNTWNKTVGLVIDGVITGYIQKHTIDHITSPSQDEKDPRAEIQKLLRSPATREKMKNLGAELLWVDIGHFDIPDEVIDEQRARTWAVTWAGKAKVEVSQGEAVSLLNQERARAEAQAELLLSILQVFDKVDPAATQPQILTRMLLSRTARVIESVAEKNQTKDTAANTGAAD